MEFVQPKSAAEDAGLRAGDRILEINGEIAKGKFSQYLENDIY